jgi:hypothetical protein
MYTHCRRSSLQSLRCARASVCLDFYQPPALTFCFLCQGMSGRWALKPSDHSRVCFKALTFQIFVSG